ncbi:MAG: putative toxin-antitoxin system toxin component, PIN family [Gemmatimonadaceae bacterium]
MRVFLDTNVLVSAFATRGLCADLFRSVVVEHDLVLGEVVLEEFRRVLKTRFRVPAKDLRQIEAYLRSYEIVPKPAEPDPIRVRDEADRWVLASAHNAQADVLVTGDSDLLSVADLAQVQIVSPREFWEKLRKIK